MQPRSCDISGKPFEVRKRFGTAVADPGGRHSIYAQLPHFLGKSAASPTNEQRGLGSVAPHAIECRADESPLELGRRRVEWRVRRAHRIAVRLCPATNCQKISRIGPMKRFAFRLRVRQEMIQEYDAAHTRVWPEMLRLLEEVGIRQYSIFRRGADLFLCMQVEDFEAAWNALDLSPINQRWQAQMAPLFEPVGALDPGERFPMMKEIFFLE
jgi:L-rhamnose mutarotase